MFGARKRGLIRQKLEIIRFFPLVNFYQDPNVSLKQNKKINFSVHSRKFKTRKIIFWPIRESLCSRNANFSRIFPLAKVSAPKVLICRLGVNLYTVYEKQIFLSETGLTYTKYDRKNQIK